MPVMFLLLFRLHTENFRSCAYRHAEVSFFFEAHVIDEPENPPTEPRPYWKRSVLWDHESEIRRRISDGQSYTQIVQRLRLPVGARRLAQFCAALGIHSLRPSRHNRTLPRADKKSAPASPAASAPAPASLADAYGPEPSDPLADLRPPTPRRNP